MRGTRRKKRKVSLEWNEVLFRERKKETWAFLVLMKVKKGKQQRNVRMNKGTFASQREREKKKAEYRETEKPNLTGKKDERYGRP